MTSDAIYRSSCPLKICSWESDPLPGETQAREALRGHLNGHSHSELIEHVTGIDSPVARYDRVSEDK